MKDFLLEKTTPFRLIAFNEYSRQVEVLNYKFTFSMVTGAPSADPENIRDAQTQQSISFSKAIAFIEGVLDNSLFVTTDMPDELQDMLFSLYENNILLLPECSEAFLMNALHSKLSAIVNENTLIERISLEDIDNGLKYTLVMDEHDYSELPDDTEWLGEFSLWDTAWWNRNDVSTFDRQYESAEELADTLEQIDLEEINELNTAILHEIEHSILGMLKEAGDIPLPQGELVEVNFADKEPKFTPKLV